MRIKLDQAVLALSDALDLVGVDYLFHGKRVGFMMLKGYAEIKTELSEDQVFQLGLLHDIGVSSTKVHRHLISELEWSGAQKHCIVGADRLKRFPPLAPLSPYVLYHHSRWEDLVAQGLDDNTATLANWLFLIDRVDTLAALHYQSNILEAKPKIINTIAKYSGSLFKPELLDLFMHLSRDDAFWLSQEPNHITAFIANRTQTGSLTNIDLSELKKLAEIFAEVVDCKSPFTHQHSLGVAKLSRYLAEQFGLQEETCAKIEIAGLLHDLGKLQIPDEILEKESGLDEHERSRITHHSYETFEILNKIEGLGDISRWAGNHHECIDGSGYPYQLKGKQLELEARLVGVSDIFQALAQERPYRAGLTVDKIREILQQLAKQHKLDQEVVSWVASHMEECYAKALYYVE